MGGLDPVGRKEVRDIIAGLRERGKTVFFSTHILSDVEMICDRVGIVIAGELTKVGELSEILSGEVQSIDVTVSGLRGKVRKALEHVGQQSIRSGDSLLVTVRGEREVDKVMAIARDGDGRIEAIVPRRKTLEDYFMAHVQDAGEK